MKNLIFAFFLICLVSNLLIAGTENQEFDNQMMPILDQYLIIHDALVRTKMTGVKNAAEKMVKLSAKLKNINVKGKMTGKYKVLPIGIKKYASLIAKAEDINEARENFLELSKGMRMWASMSKPDGVYIMYCSMVDGSWLQKSKKLLNPYYGSQMLHCGELVSMAKL